MLETLAGWFYDPWVFWGVPLLLAVVHAALARDRYHRVVAGSRDASGINCTSEHEENRETR